MPSDKKDCVRQLLTLNPDYTPREIVALAAKQGIELNTNVASIYKSKIKAQNLSRELKHKLPTLEQPEALAPAPTNGSSSGFFAVPTQYLIPIGLEEKELIDLAKKVGVTRAVALLKVLVNND